MAGGKLNGIGPKEDAETEKTYEEIMGIAPPGASETSGVGGAASLSSRLVTFRQWLANDASVEVHPSICIVNGEATDGTKNAPVLLFGPPPGTAQSKAPHPATGRLGVVDNTAERALYDRTMGCQIRTVREIKKGEAMMNVPRSAMVTPDLIACSDAGRAVLACCQPGSAARQSTDFWDSFENTTLSEKKFVDRLTKSNGTQLLVKILQERKKAEAASAKAQRNLDDSQAGPPAFKLAAAGTVSTRAPVLAFLIHQRFSSHTRPSVASESAAQELKNGDAELESTLRSTRESRAPLNSPATFGPYARTLPSAISLPLCWKRNELALLAGCIPGLPLLQEVAARTLQLASEYIALVEAGITRRFPGIFHPGLLTWDRWVWAAATFSSRALPVSCYLNKGEDSAIAHFEGNRGKAAIQSSPDVWDELGVMIPLLDMLNHEVDSAQVTWEPCVPEGYEDSPIVNDSQESSPTDSDKVVSSPPGPHGPRAVMHKRVKKGSQVYCTYGILSNQNLMLQYGFAQMGNPADEVKIGWGLGDAVGNLPVPSDYIPPASKESKTDNTGDDKIGVFESTDPDSINAWWSKERLSLLEREALVSETFLSSLQAGRKLSALAYGDGKFHPVLLSAAIVGTMQPSAVQKRISGLNGDKGLALSKTHQRKLREYLIFFFSRKLEKLLQNLSNGLKDHFGVHLWTKASQGGLQYNSEEVQDEAAEGMTVQGWQTFFDSTAYAASLEVEKMYYAMGPDSCVLTLHDGHLRALQAALDGLASIEAFEKGVIRQAEELGFIILQSEIEEREDPPHPSENGKGLGTPNSEARSEKAKDEGQGATKSRNNDKKGERPPAIKLHIGNLAYTTIAGQLYDYFANLYGRESVLECHIPIERDTGRSRGFGFVTMPESVSMQALHSGRKHEIEGRLLKLAESNSAGSNARSSRGLTGPPPPPGNRCTVCGYRPKYCVCAVPMTEHGPPPSYHGDEGRPPPDMYGEPYRDRSHDYHAYRRRSSYSRSPSYDRGGRSRRDYDRDYRDYRYGGSRSRSFSRGRDREKDRSRRDRDSRRERGRSRSRESRERRRSDSRGWDGRPSREMARYSRSRSPERGPHRDWKSGEAPPEERAASTVWSPGRNLSPISSRDIANGMEPDRKREGGDRKRSRSRSRGKSGRRKRSSKKDGSRRHGRSRSRSPGEGRSRGEKL